MGKRRKKSRRRFKEPATKEYAVFGSLHVPSESRNLLVQIDVDAVNPGAARAAAITLASRAAHDNGLGRVGVVLSSVYEVNEQYELIDPTTGEVTADYPGFDLWISAEHYIPVETRPSKAPVRDLTVVEDKPDAPATPAPAKPATTTQSWKVFDCPIEDVLSSLALGSVVEYENNFRKVKVTGGDT